MEKNFENVTEFHGENILMSIKTEPEVIFEREDNANSTTEYNQEEDNELQNIASKKAKSCCRSCIDFKSYIDDLFEKQSEKIQEQNIEIMQALEVQKDLTIRLLLQQQTAVDLKSSFPLTSQEALIEFDKQINKDNKHLYVNTMKELIRNNLFKNMDQIITEDLIYNYNVDGSHGKKGFKDLNNFYTAFKKCRYKCVSSDGDQFVKIISKTDANKEDTLKLRELLKEFGLEEALPYLKSAQVTYRSLQYIRKDDLKEAIPPMGLRIEFREKLFSWRKRKFGIDEELMPTKVQEWLNEIPSFSSSQPHEQSPYNSRGVLNKDLKSILMETAKGKKILNLYDKNQLLDDANRNDLLNIIIEEILFSKIILQQRDFSTLVDEICTIFPTERDGQEYYYIPRQGKKNPSGRLYSKYTNCRVKSRKLETSQQIESPPSTPAYINIENINELNEIKIDLNKDVLNWDEIKDMWKTTFSLRQMEVRTMCTEDFLKAWPRYRHSKAPELINIDFMLMHPFKENFLFSNWKLFKDKIKQYYEISIHNDNCNQLFSIGKTLTNKESPTTSNNSQQFMNPYQYYSITLKNEPLDDNTDDYLSEPEKKRRRDMSMQQNLEKNLLFSKYFTIKETSKNSIIGECRTCNTAIKASLTVSSNFIRHLKGKHPPQFEEYIQLKISSGRKETAKAKIDNALIDFIIENMLTFTLAEKTTFKTLVNCLNPNYSPPSMQILANMFNERYKHMINSIQAKLTPNNYFCTTADVWCTKQKLFFAYSCHWIDTNSFMRISTTLALKRFKRSHNYEEFKDIIQDVHKRFGLTNENVIATVTDNGTNYAQIFKEIGVDKFCEEDEMCNEVGDIDCIDIGEYLPHSYIKCAGHALNLYASTDFKNILVECQLYEKHVVILQKCKHLWLKSQNDIIKTLLGNTLKYPVITKWNSLYYSIQDIVKYKNNINDVCNALQLPTFSDDDFIYLKEYLEANKPIAEAIKFLQHDNNMLYGYLLPTLATIRMKIKVLLKHYNKNKYFNIIFVTKLEEKLLQRFSNYFELNDEAESAIIASVLCPDVKLDWVMALNPNASSGLKEDLARKVQNIMEAESEDSLQATQEEELPSSSKYFQFTTQENSFTSLVKTSNEFLTYMVDTSKNIEMLNKYPNIKKAFIKYNTPLPSSSASSDRLFEYSGLDFTPYSGQFTSDDYLEKLVLLKINSKKY